MGLDMYLNATRFFWTDEKELAEVLTDVFPEFENKKPVKVVVEAIYWRKSNAIHKWFVDIIQNGKDDCGSYWVTMDDLRKLRDLVLMVLKTRDSSWLPPQEGFFFGSTEVDEDYFEDMECTLSKLNEVIENYNPNIWRFEYESSW